MPHVIVKLLVGKTEQQKKDLADAIVRDVVACTGNEEKAVSVAIEEYKPRDWKEKVYGPDIVSKAETLYIKPGYKL